MKVPNQCPPAVTYNTQPWTLTVRLGQFKDAQKALERAMLEVTPKDKTRNDITWDWT